MLPPFEKRTTSEMMHIGNKAQVYFGSMMDLTWKNEFFEHEQDGPANRANFKIWLKQFSTNPYAIEPMLHYCQGAVAEKKHILDAEGVDHHKVSFLKECF